MKKEQIAWLKERNQCAKMQALEVCTRDRYLQRIAWRRVAPTTRASVLGRRRTL